MLTERVDAVVRLRFCHDVCGTEGRFKFWFEFEGWTFASPEKERERGWGCERELRADLSDAADDWRERERCESRLVRGDGASSSSLRQGVNDQRILETKCSVTHLSLHPSPVVSPIPPRKRRPSRWRTLRRIVSRSSLKIPDLAVTTKLSKPFTSTG